MQDTTEQNTVLDQLTERGKTEARAWQVFVLQFDREYPEPEPPDIERGWPWFFIGVAVISFAAVLFSATRTGPVLGYVADQFTQVADGFTLPAWLTAGEAILGTFVIEMATLFFRYSMVLTHIKITGDKSYTRWVFWAWVGAFVTQVAANLFATMGAADLLSGVYDVAQLIVAVIMGVSGIFIGFTSGDVLAHAWHDWRSKGEAELAEYKGAIEERNATKRDRWARQKRGLGIGSVTVPSVPVVPQPVAGQRDTSEETPPRRRGPSPDQQRVIEYVRDNPDDNPKVSGAMTVRALAEKLDTSKSVVQRALDYWQAEIQDTQAIDTVQDDAETE